MSISQAKKVNRAETPDFRVSGPLWGKWGFEPVREDMGRGCGRQKQILVFSVHQSHPNVQPQRQTDQSLRYF